MTKNLHELRQAILENAKVVVKKDNEIKFRFTEALLEYIDESIDHAVNDLRNQINKSGIYDPDYRRNSNVR